MQALLQASIVLDVGFVASSLRERPYEVHMVRHVNLHVQHMAAAPVQAGSACSTALHQTERHGNTALWAADWFFRPFAAAARGLGRGDTLWHAAVGGVVLLGFLAIAPLADALWESQNSGYVLRVYCATA